MHGYSALSNGIINGGCENEKYEKEKVLAVVLSAGRLLPDWQQVAEAKKTVKKKIKEAARKRRK